MSYVLWFCDYQPEYRERLGAKCASLGAMTVAGLPVPPGFAVTTDAFVHVYGSPAVIAAVADLLGSLDPEDLGRLAAASRDLRRVIESAAVPAEVEDAVSAAYAQLAQMSGDPKVPVAVRSSATSEDLPNASFAGEHDTFLWVQGEQAVLAMLRRCWSSLFTERAISYRHSMGYLDDSVQMCVAVQKMCRPRSAGVAFTLNPCDGDRSQIAIDASWGFGEAVVAGEVTPDNFLVDKVLFEITKRQVSDKESEYRLCQTRVERVPITGERRQQPCLTDEEILAVAQLARRAERHCGCPQDVEWALDEDLPDGENVLLLQSRPETVWTRRQAAPRRQPDLIRSIVATLVSPLHSKTESD